MKLVQNTLLQLFYIVFFITFSYLTINAIFIPSTRFYVMNGLIIFLGVGCVLLLLYVFNKLLYRLDKKGLIIVSVSSLLIIFLLQLFFLNNFSVNPTWDFEEVYTAAISTVYEGTGWNDYFYIRYPNNIPLFIVYVIFISFLKFIGISSSNILQPLIVLNIIAILCSLACLYIFIVRRFGYKRGALFSILSIFVTPFYIYTSIVYTDTLTMVFPILLVLLYDLFYFSKDKKRYSWLIGLGVCATIGILLKANVLIALIAIVIHFIMTTTSIKRIAVFIIAIVIPLVGINTMYKSTVYPTLPLEGDYLGFPSTHWIMMTLNDKDGSKFVGGYSGDDVVLTKELKALGLTNKEVSKQHLKIINDRITEFGPVGLLKHWQKKINFTWAEGTYDATAKLAREPLEENVYQSYIFGDKNGAFVYLSQVIHATLLVLIVASGWVFITAKNKDIFEGVMAIALFGVFLFLIIWESNARYLVLYVPMFVSLSAYGFNIFERNPNTI